MARITLHKRDSVKIDQLLVDTKASPFGFTWYVNSSTGIDSAANGKDPTAPFLTIAYAITKAAAGDTIAIQGAFTEAAACTLAGIRFIGVGYGPVMATWTGFSDGYALKLSGANCSVENIKFKPSVYNASPLLCTLVNKTGIIAASPVALGIGSNTPTVATAGTFTLTLPAGVSAALSGLSVSPSTATEGVTVITTSTTGTLTIAVTCLPSAIRLTTGANYTKIKGCRFQGQATSQAAIYADAAVDNVQILDNEFLYMNNVTTSPYGCGIYGVSTSASWIIRGNTFNSCRAAIILGAHCAIIADNIIKYYGLRADNTYNTVLAMGIDLSSGYGCNTITNNQLGGAYSNSLYLKAATGDEWAGNWTLSTTGTITNGQGMTLTATA